MKSIRNMMLTVLCGISCSVVGMEVEGGAPAVQPIPQPFSFGGWVKNTDGMRKGSRLNKAASFTGSALALGVGGLVGTGFITKKMVRVCKEAIALKKQIQQNPKDRSLRKKRRTLIGKAIGMGIGGLVLFLFSGVSLFLGTWGAKKIRKNYVKDKKCRADERVNAMRCNLMSKQLKRDDYALGIYHVPLSSAQLENYALLMADEPLPLRKPRSGDTLDSHVFGQPSPYRYDSKTKTWTSIFHGKLKSLDEYGGKTWKSFGFTDPAEW